METPLNTQGNLLAKAKALATREDNTPTGVAKEGQPLQPLAVTAVSIQGAESLPALPISRHGGGLLPGINGTSNQSMFEAAWADLPPAPLKA